MHVSRHAQKRLKERCGATKKSGQRMADRAFERGLTHKDVSGRLGRWVDGVYLQCNRGNQIRLYGDKCYIFHNNVLITVIPIPQNMMYLVKDAFTKKKAKETENGKIESR